MRKFLHLMLFVALAWVPAVSMSQGNGFVCDFEDDNDTASWDYVADTTRLKWHVGNATGCGEGRSIYISSDNGVSNTYYGSEVYAYAYRTVHLVAGDYEFSYDWKCNGEGNYDFLRVALAPASAVLASGTNNGITRNQLPSGWIALDGGDRLNQSLVWRAVSGNVSIASEGDYKVVLYWHNDRSVVNNPAAAVDNVSLMIPTCREPKRLLVSGITGEGATISWSGVAQDWEVEYMVAGGVLGSGNNMVETVSDSSIVLSGLLSNTAYDVYVKGFCGEGYSRYAKVSFRTACGDMNLPLVESFELETVQEAPACWTVQSGTAIVDENYSINVITPFGSKFVHMYGACVLALPRVGVAGNTLAMDMYVSRDDVETGRLAVGFVADLADIADAEYVDTIDATIDSMSLCEIDFSSLGIAEGGYIVLKQFGNRYYGESSGFDIDNIYIRQLSDCARPETLTVSEVGARTAKLEWTSVWESSTYDVMYGTMNDPTSAMNTLMTGVLDDTLMLDQLIPETEYYVWVRSNCGEEYSEWRAGGSFTTEMACAEVKNVKVSSLSYSGFALTWSYDTEIGEPATQTEVGWKKMSEGSYQVEVVDQNFFIFQGLEAGTRYDVRLRTICNTDTAVAYMQTVATSMYGFQVGAAESIHDCVPIDAFEKNNYSQSLYLASELNGLDVISGIAFNIDCDRSGDDRTWDVYLGHTQRTNLNSMDYLPLDSLTLVADSVAYAMRYGWSGVTFDTPFTYDGSSNLVIAINDHSNTKERGVYFKVHDGCTMVGSNSYMPFNPASPSGMLYTYSYSPDVLFMQAMNDNGCDAPLAVVTNVTDNSVDVVWNTNANASVYQVEYQLLGSTDWSVAADNISDSIFTVDNLSSGIYYNFRVGMLCDNDTVYSNEMEALTLCGMASVPYSENFGGSELNPCWSYGNKTVANNLPYVQYGALYMNYEPGGYAILPQMEDELSMLHVTFSIKSRTQGARMVVAVGEDASDINSFVVIDTFATTSVDEFTPYECSLGNYWGDGHYIAFITVDKYIYLDDVVVDLIPSCGYPTDVTISDIMTTTATVNWDNEVSGSLQWMIVYGEEGSTERDTVYALPTDNNYPLSNLLPNKSYEVMLYNICGNDTVGMLTSVFFRTECGDIELPYYEDFNDIAIDSYHPCWYTTEFHTYGTWSQITAPTTKNQGGVHGRVVMFGDNADVISPHINVPINTVQLGFDARIENRMFGGDLAIGFTTSTSDLSGAIYVDTIDFAHTDWEHYDVSFENIASSSQGYIVFKNFGNTEYVDWSDPSSSMYYNGYLDNVMITIDNDCDKVTQVAVGNVTQTTAEITFEDVSATGDYTIGYSTDNDINNITTTQDFTTTTATLTNLQSGTHYFVWVRKNCGANTSLWAEGGAFTTLCDAIDEMPYYEHFDSYTADIQESLSSPSTYPNHTMPSCWSFINMSQDRQSYPQVYLCKPNSFINYSDSAVCMMFITGTNTSVFAVMPEFTTHVSMMELSFMYRNEGTSPSNGILTLGVLTDATDSNTFVPLQTYPIVSQMTPVSHNFRLDALDLNTDYRIAFRYAGTRERFRLTIDRVELVASSECVTPENLTVGAITSESIALSWAGIASNYNVQYREPSESVWTSAPTISGTHAVLTGLSPQTEYEMRVQSNCGSEVSEWTVPVRATTGCAAAALPYIEDFNTYEAGRGTSTDTYPPLDLMDPTLPYCWYFPQMGIPTPLAFMTSASEYASSGMCLFMMSDSLVGLYAVLPEMDAPVTDLTLNFTYRNEGTNSHMAPLEVGVMTNPADINTFVTLETMPLTATKTNASHVFSMDAQLDENEFYYIAFKYGGTGAHGSQYYLSIDDVVVDYSASCHKPTQFRVDNVTASSASVHWFGDASNYEVNYRLTSEQDWTTMNTTDMHVDLTDLIGNSQYSVRVRALCGADDNSEWTTEALFTTECASMDLPYLETFTDFVLYDFGRYCWNRYYGLMDSVMNHGTELRPATGGWGFSDMYPFGNDGTNMWIDIWGTAVSDWSVSPQINLTSATQVEFDMARFDYSGNDVWQADDQFAILVTADEGNTWQLLRSWNGMDFPNIPVYSDSSMHVTIDLSQYDNETIRLAFYGESTVRGGDHLILIDNLEVTGSNDVNPNCDTPTALTATAITDDNATLSWQGNANSYQLQYRRVDAWNWVMVAVNGTSQSLSDLNPGTDYEWRVRAVCSEGEYSLWSDNSQFTTTGEAPVCNPVAYVSVSDIDTTSAMVTWFAGGEEEKWEVEYGVANFALGQGERVVVNEEEYLLEELKKRTIYDVYVRAICGENFYSEWSEKVQFTTLSGETPEGIDGIEGDYQLNVYPNPTSGATTISLSGVNGKVIISLLDINGRQITSEELECAQDCEKRIDVAGLAQGTYFVRVLGDDINSVRKLIVR